MKMIRCEEVKEVGEGDVDTLAILASLALHTGHRLKLREGS